VARHRATPALNTLTLIINRCALALTALLAASGTLTACGRKDETAPPTPGPAVITALSATIAASGLLTGGGLDGSRPDSSAALATSAVASAAKPGPVSTMTQDQASEAMPLPGQANDPSTPAPSEAKGS
jgi:hypothetical protein